MCTMPAIEIEAAANSHVGRRRKNNEDSFAALPELGLFMVADGLGGNAAGEIASQMAVTIVKASIEEDDPDDTMPFGFGEARDRDEARLILSLRRANRGILDASRYRIETRGMATTFAGVLLTPAAAYIAHVGDSRVYRFRGGRLEQLTRDHSVLEELLQQGELMIDDEGGLPAHLNAVTRALGIDKAVEIETRVEPTDPGDLFLVCSDGLWGPVPDAGIAAILAAHTDLDAAAAALIDCATERGGPDNVTCVLVRVRTECLRTECLRTE
jgi:PPM family protein phosphatase